MRLSSLQKYIIGVIAKHTFSEYSKDWSRNYMTSKQLFHECYDFWPEVKGDSHQAYLSRQAVFSRTMRNLIKKGFVVGIALAWVIHDGYHHEDILAWQGGGGKERYTFMVDGKKCIGKSEVPRYRMYGLDENGWELARKLEEGTR